MAIKISKSHLRIEENRKWEDYKSLKQHFSNKGYQIREWIWSDYETLTNAAAEPKTGTDDTIAFLAANDIVYIKSEADLAALDGDSIWMDYVSSTGVLYEAVESKLDSETSTATEVPIGCESGTYVDTIASIAGDACTMTNLNASVADSLAGWYIVASGDATHQEGNYLTILSNTAASPTVITCTATPGATWDDDNVSVQQTLNNDVYRIRRIWSETEAPTDNALLVCDKDETNIYATICDGDTTGGPSRYFSLSSDYRCFIGRVRIITTRQGAGGADNELGSHELTCTYTPLAWNNPLKNATSGTESAAAADIKMMIAFENELDWQPCIELEPATDVTFGIRKVLAENYPEAYIEITCLEVRTV